MKCMLGLSAEPITDRVNEKFCGVGMIRSEYLCREIEQYVTIESCRKHIYDYVSRVCELFYPDPVWYRTSEFVTPEANVLQGNEEFIEEKHYVIGLRGIRRGLKYKESLELELQIISELSKKFSNLNILFSYIKDINELTECIKLLENGGFKNKYGVMVEIPSVVFSIDDFIACGVSNLTIGMNDLTMLMLGTYRGSEYHDFLHPTMRETIKFIAKKGKENNVMVNVGGYLTPELYEFCKEADVDNVIINYNVIPKVFNVSENFYPYINHVSKIKKITKTRINNLEIQTWKEKLNMK